MGGEGNAKGGGGRRKRGIRVGSKKKKTSTER